MTDVPRIAVITPRAASSDSGGVEVFNEQLRRALGGLEVFAEEPPLGDGTPGKLGRVGLAQPYRALGAARRLLRRHREDPFDLVISNGLSGWPLTFAKLGVPAVQVYHLTLAGLARHALSLRGDRWTTGRVTAWFDRLSGVGKHVVAVSPRVVREVKSYYGLSGQFIPNGVDTSSFSPADRTACRKELGLPLDVPIGLFVGRTDYSKGYDIVLRVAQQMPDVLFVVVGGAELAYGNVRLVGRIPHSRMPHWYAASDFLFSPSRYEGFNLALIEALACDVPAVVSEAAYALPEEPSRYGVVVRGNDESKFAEAIRTVLAADGTFRPRDSIESRYSFEAFRNAWRSRVVSLIGTAGRPAV